VTRHRWLAAALGLLVMVGVLSVAVGREPSRAAVPRVAGSLRLSAEVAAPGSTLRVRGWVAAHTRRPVVLQRSVGGAWRSVATATSRRGGRYRLTTTVPDLASTLVRYRVLMPRWRGPRRVQPRAVTPVASVRTTDAPATGPDQPSPTATPTPSPPPPSSPPPTDPTGDPTGPVVAEWTMDEPAGSTVMVDRSGHGHHGQISQDAASAGLQLTGSDYVWSERCRDCPPTSSPRVVQVPDSPDLEIPDPAVRWSLELRFRTTTAYGNLMQKGQVTTAGGEIKVEDPIGLKCVFKGTRGDALTRSPQPLNDGLWHTVTCVHTATSVSQWVDGVLVAETRAATGPIDNREPFVVGGKILCDQQQVGCDYYSGTIDWARITRG
jgi:hypothetical protein